MKNQERGFSLIELLIVVAIILIIAAIAIPNLLKARIAANEASGANCLRTVATAQLSYKIYYDTYAKNLDELGPTQSGIITDRLAVDPYQQSGYQFNTVGTVGTFTASAIPISPNSKMKSYCTDTPAAIYYETTSTCDPQTSPPIK